MGKKIASVIITAITTLTVTLTSCTQSNMPESEPVNSQEDIIAESDLPQTEPVVSQHDKELISDLTDYLKQQGVPLISVEAVGDDSGWHPPIVLEFRIRSLKEGDEGIQEKVIYTNLIGRAANLAHRRGLGIGAFSEIWVDSRGEEDRTGTGAVLDLKEIDSLFDPPQELDNDTAATLLRQNLYLHGMTLEKLDVSLDSYDYRWVTFNLRMSDMETANNVFPSFLSDVRVTIRDLNAGQNTKITICRINISTTSGELLLKYMRDLQMGRQSWWQADGFTMDWFPHPPPPSEE
jgi:hypothetical protein